MADAKISALTQLTGVPAATDEVVLVDKSDTTDAASGTTKRMQYTDLIPTLGNSWGGLTQIASAPASNATGATNTYYTVYVEIPARTGNVSGIRYRVGGTSNGNVRSALYSQDGQTQHAVRTTNAAQGTINQTQVVAFDSSIQLDPGIYLACLWFSSATATWMGARLLIASGTGTNASNPPSTVTPPTSVIQGDTPLLTTYAAVGSP